MAEEDNPLEQLVYSKVQAPAGQDDRAWKRRTLALIESSPAQGARDKLGAPVLSAGEITFERGPSGWEATSATNQSTGYCPEPSSWPAVARALDRIGVPHPGRFTDEFTFRRCPQCGVRIPIESVHRFRSNPYSGSGVFVHLAGWL